MQIIKDRAAKIGRDRYADRQVVSMRDRRDDDHVGNYDDNPESYRLGYRALIIFNWFVHVVVFDRLMTIL